MDTEVFTKQSLPAFNINGSDPEKLANEWHEAYKALDKAIETFARATFHPRDFQFQPTEVYLAARTLRESMLAKLNEVQNYTMDWYEHAYDSKKNK